MANTLKDSGAKAFNVFHRTLVKVTKGKVGGKAFGLPVVILTTTGRKSGQARQTMLTSLEDGDRVILIASWGGDDRHPQWYLNLQANPDVTIVIHNQTKQMRARTASADEKATLWPKMAAKYKGYDGYQEKTERDIPVVILEPR